MAIKNSTKISQAEIEQLKSAWGVLCLVSENMDKDDTDAFISGDLVWLDSLVKCSRDSLCELWETLEGGLYESNEPD